MRLRCKAAGASRDNPYFTGAAVKLNLSADIPAAFNIRENWSSPVTAACVSTFCSVIRFPLTQPIHQTCCWTFAIVIGARIVRVRGICRPLAAWYQPAVSHAMDRCQPIRSVRSPCFPLGSSAARLGFRDHPDPQLPELGFRSRSATTTFGSRLYFKRGWVDLAMDVSMNDGKGVRYATTFHGLEYNGHCLLWAGVSIREVGGEVATIPAACMAHERWSAAWKAIGGGRGYRVCKLMPAVASSCLPQLTSPCLVSPCITKALTRYPITSILALEWFGSNDIFAMSLCRTPFTTLWNIERHEITICGMKSSRIQFQCDLCQRQLTWSDNFMRHYEISSTYPPPSPPPHFHPPSPPPHLGLPPTAQHLSFPASPSVLPQKSRYVNSGMESNSIFNSPDPVKCSSHNLRYEILSIAFAGRLTDVWIVNDRINTDVDFSCFFSRCRVPLIDLATPSPWPIRISVTMALCDPYMIPGMISPCQLPKTASHLGYGSSQYALCCSNWTGWQLVQEDCASRHLSIPAWFTNYAAVRGLALKTIVCRLCMGCVSGKH
ncbi:hypothetical protein PR048_013466 [Dryococelus australis]|uniref:Uncharacterized protein n=1 Tax=Dryococelus australis TaxID=614101 RepID=A0ABQ9HS95_9NEOP|nr:hypothetical protein PR048_013466 [Dryococelus australis]